MKSYEIWDMLKNNARLGREVSRNEDEIGYELIIFLSYVMNTWDLLFIYLGIHLSFSIKENLPAVYIK